jgi:hypothetical protein
MRAEFFKKISTIFFLAIFFARSEFFFGEEWILAATKFSFSQNKKRSASEENLCEILPALVLEKMSENILRTTSREEMTDRRLNELLVERQSFFLQLSKEIKVRDGFVLSAESEKKIRRKILAQEKKIDEIKKNIDENLETTKKISDEFRSENSAGNSAEIKTEFSPLAFNPLKNLFVKKNENLIPPVQSEFFSLYKNDAHILFSPTDDALAQGIESRKFETEVLKQKINGVLDGKITVYENYFSVTCSLYVFPGGKKIGTVTEVAQMQNLVSAAENLAEYFSPVISNSFPVEIFFDVQSEDADDRNEFEIFIDGKKYDSAEKIILPQGTHTIKIQRENFVSRAATFDFKESGKFTVSAKLEKEKIIPSSMFLKNPQQGKIYAENSFLADTDESGGEKKIVFNGNAFLGEFKSSEDDKKLFFFYADESVQKENSALIVKGRAQNHEELIDRRRRSAYIAYSALVLSMPFTIFTAGRHVSMVNAYNAHSLNDADEVNRWRNYRIISSGVTFACLGFFIVELSRYIYASSSVLPVNAKIAAQKEIEKFSVQNPAENFQDETIEIISENDETIE